MNDDLISRREAIDTLAEWNDAAITNRLNNLAPVDAVPVIRCKNCSKWCICHHSDDWFCADGTPINTASDFYKEGR